MQHDVLIFTLAAHMASFGELAGTTRGTERTPSFSSLVGLLGAALGIQRGDDLLVAISQEYAPAVKVVKDGGVLEDFHTVETPNFKKTRPFRTRSEELDGKTGTVLTRRIYRQDVEYQVAIFSLVSQPEIDVHQCLSALERPRYTLYAGRRNCPLSKPPAPKVLTASTVSEVLGTENIVYDSRLDGGDCQAHHEIERMDLLTGNRQFGIRRELIV